MIGKYKYDKTRRAKLNTICNLLTDNIEELLPHLHLRYRRTNRLIYMPCPVHCGDNQQACNIYLDGNFVRGNWVCFTQNCHKTYGTSIISFIRGVLSTQNDRSYNVEYAIDYCLDFLGYKYSDVPYDLSTLSRQDFITQSNILSKLPSTSKTHYTKEYVRSALHIPSPYFLNRGFSIDTLVQFDVGECHKEGREMCGRAVFPVYEPDGMKMAGCVGRSIYPRCNSCGYYHKVGDACVFGKDAVAPYTKWRNSNKFNKQSYLYNFWNAQHYIDKTQTCVIVEGQCDVLRLAENGINNVVSIFGVDMSDEQSIILERCNLANVVLLLNNDKAGIDGTKIIKDKMKRLYRVSTPEIKANDVDEMGPEELAGLVSYIRGI